MRTIIKPFATSRKLLLTVLTAIIVTAANAAGGAWITSAQPHVNDTNTWIAFQKTVNLKRVPRRMTARIACDSKYWLWINGKEVVTEGQLKRGPKPGATYYDEVDLSKALSKGRNIVSVLVWYYGKSGFSHADSGKSGLIIDAEDDNFDTDKNWLCTLHPAFGMAPKPYPNYRLPESSISFNANNDMPKWYATDCKGRFGFAPAVEIGSWGSNPWGEMVLRPIPMLKYNPIKYLPFTRKEDKKYDIVEIRLPGNLQFTPVFELTDPRGNNAIDIRTDHFRHGSAWNVRAEYITTKGRQSHESPGWMNGEVLQLRVPKDVKVHSLGYRESGYDTSFDGKFECDNDFVNRFWSKALNTLYVNMRDTYMDCPERERAQWWGDETFLGAESFYTCSLSSHALMRKGIYELCNWQDSDGKLFAPVPGSWNKELPSQMLASVSLYGFWNYYMNTGDAETIRFAYPHVKKYLARYSTDSTGLTAPYSGAWNWGDWGNHRDIRLIYAAWHYMALESAAKMAELQGLTAEAEGFRNTMTKVKEGYNRCWNGFAYRHPTYLDATDDRVQALAVISGIAEADKYDAIYDVLTKVNHSSPYMEKYVMEALFIMNRGDYAMKRMKKRFAEMVDDKANSTLYEFWTIKSKSPGSSNHAWSGGPLIIISQYLMGVSPLEAGYKKIKINPQYVEMNNATLEFPSVAGTIKTSFRKSDTALSMAVTVPKASKALVYLPTTHPEQVLVNGKPLGKNHMASDVKPETGKTPIWLGGGEYNFNIRLAQ